MRASNRFVAALLIGTAICSPALANEAEAFARGLSETYKSESGFRIDLLGGAASGTNFTYDGIAISAPEYGLTTPIEIPTDVTVTGAKDIGDGRYTADRLYIPEASTTQLGFTITLSEISASGLFVSENPTALELTRNLETFSIDAASVTFGEGVEVASLSGVSMISEFDAAAGSPELTHVETVADIKAFSVNPQFIPISDVARFARSLGIDALTGNATLKADYNLTTGDVSVDTRLSADNLGTGTLELGIGGFTIDTYEKSRQADLLALELEANGDTSSLAEVEALAMDVAGALSLTKSSLRFDDAGLVDKVLNAHAAPHGRSPEELRKSMAQIAPRVLGYMFSEEVAASIGSAFSDFITTPENITIFFDLEEPVSMENFVELAADRAEFDRVLKPSAVANQ